MMKKGKAAVLAILVVCLTLGTAVSGVSARMIASQPVCFADNSTQCPTE
ncbi:hypothetical protein [Paenibacillus soyae]|uniref:Uncharacterized protein n=1 Tax=Paenibacillus soyae TaxID=2969249 RepID=A0A9X2S968_9BACL|nr:hypothetical protein [Paenibacillus soyae]MCR2802417.1 hypothetical protein [Paenibacillus soyae]